MRSAIIIISLVLLGGCSLSNSNKAKNITVFVAASLTDVVTEIVDSFEVKHNVNINLNMGSSGMLARQINQGAICDVYLSANKKWMEYVEERGMLLDSTILEVCKNKLVLITPNSKVIDSLLPLNKLPNLLQGERLSIGDPSHVPAGKYAVEALKTIGVYSQLQDKLLPAKDVRNALMVVELGESPLGIVYKTDALKSQKVSIYQELPDSIHSPIKYLASTIKTGENNSEGVAFLRFLNHSKVKPIWKKHGFIVE